MIYNALLIVFAWTEGMSIRGEGLKLMSAGCVILAIVGFLGILLTSLLTLYMSVNTVVTPEWSAYIYLTPMDIVTNSLILFGAAIVAGYIPSWRIAQEDIQKSMRS